MYLHIHESSCYNVFGLEIPGWDCCMTWEQDDLILCLVERGGSIYVFCLVGVAELNRMDGIFTRLLTV